MEMSPEYAFQRWVERAYARQQDRPLRFAAQTRDQWKQWQAQLREKMLELSGFDIPPEPCDLSPRVVAREELGEHQLIREKIVYQTEPDVWVPAYLLRPLNPGPKPRPAIVALHGHGGRWGKVTVAGVAAEHPQVEERIALYNYDYGLQFARRGYVVLCPDARVFGERAAGWWNPPEPAKGFDPCDRAGNKASLLGYSLVGLTTWDDRRGIDYLQTRDDVDAGRIGAAGLSLGGARSLFLAARDDRVRATIISGCLCTYLAYALRQQFCGGQFVHGLLRWADLPDVAALIAPRPLLIEAGLDDDIFPIEASREAHRVLEAAYHLLDAEQHLWRDEFPGGHRWSGARAYDFMERYLPCKT